MENYGEFLEFAPLIVVVLLFIWQNNIFVKPEQLEKKHREILDNIKRDFVEINAYKEFQNRVYSELTEVNNGINELKDYLTKGVRS